MFGITIIVVVILMVMLYMGHIASRLASSAELATEPGRSIRRRPRKRSVVRWGRWGMGKANLESNMAKMIFK